MARASKPDSLTVRAYDVGFGDCFLLTFHYKERDRHVLVDFGTTGSRSGKDKDTLSRVGNLIVKHCTDARGKAKLDAVVVTHRHRDHIRGFSTDPSDGACGTRIAKLAPDLVVQPWTEAPKAPRDSKGSASPGSRTKGFRTSNRGYMSMLGNMTQFAKSLVGGEARRFMTLRSVQERRQLAFVGEDNLKNESAVRNLMKMAKAARLKGEYLSYGSSTKLEQILPGVKVNVLGPPTITQHARVKTEAETNPEFWMLQSIFWLGQARMMNDRRKAVSTPQPTRKNDIPLSARWFVQNCDQVRASQLLSLVRIVDGAMNNTSLILLFQIGSRKFLFPGDAQIENWEYALRYAPDAKKNLETLKDVTLYKVGHHGSRNATPKTLFKVMAAKRNRSDRLTSMNSTMPDKHGDTANRSEVPRGTLVRALKKRSRYLTTEHLSDETPYIEETFSL